MLEEDKNIPYGVSNEAHIMVMDDDPIIRRMIKDVLEHLGYHVVLASDGHQAIDLYKEFLNSDASIDLVLMDLTIPCGMGGRVAIQEILKVDPEARVILTSGYSKDPAMSDYKDYGFKSSLKKPFKVPELKSLINTVLQSN
ncbi:MAG: response regulator [Lentisphaeria bacterium]|nr:response regulator [Lentisphaeria bacterium]NQZ69513.1 response regulator [Lentisphaeria bacterium]